MVRTIGRRIGMLLIALSLLLGSDWLYAIPSAHAAVEGDFIYEDIGGGNARITGYGGTGGMVVIPGHFGVLTVTEIGASAFGGKGLTGVTFPDSLTTIGGSAFRGNQIAELTVPSGVTVISEDAFRANRISVLNLPDTLLTIEEQAFTDNELTELVIPSGLETVGRKAFKYNQLASLSLPDSVTTIDEGAFEANRLTEIRIPAGLTSIGTDVFKNNQLTEVSIPNTITSIGWSAFLDNPALVKLTIPDSVTTIGPSAFENSGLTRLRIPNSVTSIDDRAFANSPLQEVLILNPGILLNGDDVFGMHPDGMTLYGPGGSAVQTYATANGISFRTYSGGLASLQLDISGLNFDPLERTFRLLTNAPAVTVTAAPVIPFSEIRVNHVAVPEGMPSDPIPLAEGTQTIAVDVKSPDEATEHYQIVLDVDHTAPVIGLSASPAGSTYGPVTVTANVYGAAAAADSVKWASGARTAAYFAGAGTSFIGDFTVSANGTYTVYARDEAGNEAVSTIAVANIRESATPEPTVPAEPEKDPAPETELLIDRGILLLKVAPKDVKEVQQADGRMVDEVNLPQEILDQLPEVLDQAERPFVRVVIGDRHPVVRLQLPAGPLGEWMSDHPQLAFEARLNGSSFRLEASVLDLERLAALLGADKKEVRVTIAIASLTDTDLDALAQAAREQKLKLIGSPVEFRLIVSGGGKTLEVTDFGGTYLLKSIVLDEGVRQRDYTAVLYDPAQRSFTYVPAVAAKLTDGRSEAVMRMPHNSIYAIMEADPVRFADMTVHWANPEVAYMASKRIVSGVSASSYAPDRAITRAEFTALLVRALGIRTEASPAGDRFADVPASAWYASAVEAGASAGLASGVGEARFAPEQPVTREQIAVMLATARKLAGEETANADPAASAYALSRFEDAERISPWARDALAEAAADGIIQGMTPVRLAPAETATRAQAAVMLARMLRSIGFLD